MKIIHTVTDPNSPDFGQVTEEDVPDAPKVFRGGDQRRALVRGRAAQLDKRGKYSEATALRATIGE